MRRVAEERGLSVRQVDKLVEEHTSSRILGFMGEPFVNMLELDIALKGLAARS
ncbi:potassium-transporting ATPase subunit C [Streptomyces sp. NPDC056121]|uniref:potassium-transporting ATPase subunit C n=1 Tax=Streptomyces sp. NPDC056121 TaxID=3345718 RepID=UPI0035DC1239